MAEHAVNLFKSYFPHQKNEWTKNTRLPGGCFESKTFFDFKNEIKNNYQFLAEKTINRYLSCYGSRTNDLLAGITSKKDMGYWIADELSEHEISFLKRYEWAQSAEDILWRRTKLGLVFLAKHKKEVEQIILEN